MHHIRPNRRHVLGLGCASLFPRLAGAASTTIVRIEGVAGERAKRVSELVETFGRDFALPGVSVAIAHRGKLKLLACYGEANREGHEPVRPHHQFRVASVSKPVTSVAILRLVEQNRLGLDETVFGAGGRLSEYADAIADPKRRAQLQKISVRHLLEHSCGGWSNKGGEAPMFAQAALGMSHPDLIRWTLKNVPLKRDAGEQYAYSNFGYCLLGRVIESVTGRSYEAAVKQLVLQPAGAGAMFVGAQSLADRRANEVVYYDEYDPYGANMDVARMDAHGGWVASPTELVRFALHADGFESPRDLLSPASIKTMTTVRRGSYALGWQINKQNNWWHTGGFNGGSSILARINDGHCWAVVVNTRSSKSGYYAALDSLPWKIKAAVSGWGSHDLFRS